MSASTIPDTIPRLFNVLSSELIKEIVDKFSDKSVVNLYVSVCKDKDVEFIKTFLYEYIKNGYQNAAENDRDGVVSKNGTRSISYYSIIQSCYISLIEEMIEWGFDQWEEAIRIAIEEDSVPAFNFFRPKSAIDDNLAMWLAANHNAENIVNLLVSEGATFWNSGLIGAIHSGNIKMVEFFVEKGADDWIKAKTVALYTGDIVIIDYIFKKHAESAKQC